MQEEFGVGLVDLTPSTDVFLNDVIEGLSQVEKTLPCKYFYDRRGSRLFDAICELDEYYLTRTELKILRQHAAEIAEAIGPRAMIIEPGSGSSVKTQILLDRSIDPCAYVPVDISREHLCDTAEALSQRYPKLPVLPVSADFTMPFDLPKPPRTPRRRVVFFPGSTIGNFSSDGALELLRQMAELCGRDGVLIIGIDLKKDPRVLEAAYDDGEGVTAQFNLNILWRINRELEADFDLEQFEHLAKYNAAKGRVEIFLVSRREQCVTIGDQEFEFAEGELICTEHSHKYNVEEFAEMAQAAGFELSDQWSDTRRYFAVLCLRVNSSK